MKIENIPFPKEYGSWGILLTSCIIGLAISGHIMRQSYLAFMGIAIIFMSKASIGIFIRRHDKNSLIFTVVYLAIGLLLILPALLLIDMSIIMVLLIIPLAAIIVYALSAYLHKERSSIVEFFAMAALTLPAAFFQILPVNRINMTILVIWLMVFLYFSASIFRVKMLIFKNKTYRLANMIYLIIIVIFIYAAIHEHVMPWLVGIAFLPLIENLVDTFRYINKRSLKVVGVTELIKGTIFAVILILIAKNAFL